MRLARCAEIEEIGREACNDAGCGRLSQNGTASHFGTKEEGLRAN